VTIDDDALPFAARQCQHSYSLSSIVGALPRTAGIGQTGGSVPLPNPKRGENARPWGGMFKESHGRGKRNGKNEKSHRLKDEQPCCWCKRLCCKHNPRRVQSNSLVAQAVATGFRQLSWGSVLDPIFSVVPPTRPAVATS